MKPPLEDPMIGARKFLAELHTQTQVEEKRLHAMRTQGADHFRPGLEKAVETMTEHDLDNYTREAGALASMQNGAGL